MVESLLSAISTVCIPMNLLMIIVGAAVGVFIGAMPGLSSVMGLSLMLPLVLKFEGTTGILMLLGVFCGAIYGGAITAILIKTPGTANSAATVLDGYPMTQKGQAARALGISTFASVFGGIFSAIMLMWTAPLLSKIALSFTSPEYFALAILGLSMVVSLSGKNVTKGLISAVLGLLMGTVGMDTLTGVKRFTFDTTYLMGGISMVTVLIALYAFAQIMQNIELHGKTTPPLREKLRHVFPGGKTIKKILPTLCRSSLIGSVLGAIPGIGGDIACWMAYNTARRCDKHPEQFGTGRIEGIAAPEAANNAISGGALIPLLTLGIPGDAGTAIMLGALMMQGIVPGPLLFTSQQAEVYTIIIGLLLANIAMGLIGFGGIRLISRMGSVKNRYMVPIIVTFCIIGTFALNSSINDIFLMMALGIIAFLMIKMEYPMPPVILGLILGDQLERNLQRSLSLSDGDFFIFLQRPVAAFLLAAALLSVVLPVLWKLKKQRKKKEVNL